MTDSDTGTLSSEHFSEEDWVDVARQRGDPARRARLAQHLEDACPRCAQMLRVWSAVLSVADQESSPSPSREAIRSLEAGASSSRPGGLGERVMAEVALLFDSFRQPLPAGARSAGRLPRFLLYKAGRYAIRVRVEPAAAPGGCSIAGQILDEQEPTRVLQDIAVRAMKGSRTLDRTLTNQLGEFHLQPAAADELQLSLGVPEIGTFTVEPPRWAQKPPRGAEGRPAAGTARTGKGTPR